ncbi:MAG TPA: class I SAM-dependent methyltransferase [Solirubrobacteraceae bacterium]|nr:class I SAM-dependent methyltransferase [Solirubrobacteraceae bacterium]
MTASVLRVSPEWLSLREPADAEARARDLVEHLKRERPAAAGWVIHDLGCGTGAMGRWLTPRLPGAQHWVLHDRDSDLLAVAANRPASRSLDASPVTLELRQSDITRLESSDLAGASLITASALLDILTEEELARLIGVCSAVACPVLLTLSVVGLVELIAPEPLDRQIAAAFDAHQRRVTDRGALLGPDAVAAAVEQSMRLGAEVLVSPSPWRLGPDHRELAAEWLTGWIGAACEQDAALATAAEAYTGRRLDQAAAGELRVIVHHADLLILPGGSRPTAGGIGR